MIKVIAEDFINPEFIEKVKPLYQELVLLTKKEDNCIDYNLFIDQDEPGHFIFIEEWPSMEALEMHCNTEHFRRLVPLIDKHQLKEGTVLIMNPF